MNIIDKVNVRKTDGIPISIKRYSFIYAGFFTGLLILLNVICSLLNIDVGMGLKMGVTIGAVFGTLTFFFKEQNRTPNKSELRRLTWGSLTAAYLVSLLAFLLIWILDYQGIRGIFSVLFTSVHPAIWVFAFAITTLIYALVIKVLYSIAGQLIEKQNNKGN